jgi:hypothetical protein
VAKRYELYVVNGEKIACMVEQPDGSGEILAWDFAKGRLTREAADMGDFFGGDPESYQITKEEFDKRLAELRDGEAALKEEAERAGRRRSTRRVRRGVPEPLTRRRGRGTEVTNLERAIRAEAACPPCGEKCGAKDKIPEEVEKALDVVKKIYGKDDPQR